MYSGIVVLVTFPLVYYIKVALAIPYPHQFNIRERKPNIILNLLQCTGLTTYINRGNCAIMGKAVVFSKQDSHNLQYVIHCYQRKFKNVVKRTTLWIAFTATIAMWHTYNTVLVGKKKWTRTLHSILTVPSKVAVQKPLQSILTVRCPNKIYTIQI
jgi:hypothetical protein